MTNLSERPPKQLRKRTPFWVHALGILGIIFLVAGCFRIDYAVFKVKYPSAGIGSYLWSRGK